jgi:hypothetical protein
VAGVESYSSGKARRRLGARSKDRKNLRGDAHRRGAAVAAAMAVVAPTPVASVVLRRWGTDTWPGGGVGFM